MNKKHFLNKLLKRRKYVQKSELKNNPINTIKDKDILLFKLIKSLIKYIN